MTCTSRWNRTILTQFESLESRTHFSAGIPVMQSLGDLTVKGTAAPLNADRGRTSSVSEPADIVWINRANTTTSGANDTDGFGATFGTTAPIARAVVDAVIVQYERMIGSFNYQTPGQKFVLNIFMLVPGSGFVTGVQSLHQAFGIPDGANLGLGAGNNTPDPNDDNGWFIDPTPFDNREFFGNITNAFAGDAYSGSPAFNKPDLFTAAATIISHGVGLTGAFTLFGNRTTNTNVPDDLEGGGVGTLWLFQGPSIKHLLTSNLGGPGGQSSAQPWNTAGVGDPLTWGNDVYYGAEDVGNSLYEYGRRYLPSLTTALMLKDAYGYSVNDPSTWGTFYTLLDQSTGYLWIRGGDFVPGQSESDDSMFMFGDGSAVNVWNDIGKDVPGTGALPGAGNLPWWESKFNFSNVGGIIIDSGAGNDTIDIVANVGRPVIGSTGGPGNDSIRYSLPSQGMNFIRANANGFDSSGGTVTVDGGFEHATISGAAAGVTDMIVVDTAPGRALTVFAGSATAHITILGGNAERYPSPVVVNGAGYSPNDTLTINDGSFGGSSTYNVNPGSIQKNNGFAGLTYSDIRDVTINGEQGNNTFNIITGDGQPIHVNGGAGTDTYSVTGTGANAPVYIDSAAGADNLIVQAAVPFGATVIVDHSDTFGVIGITNGRLDLPAGSQSTLACAGLVLFNASVLNLNDNDLIIDYADGSFLPYAEFWIKQGRDTAGLTGFVSRTALDNPQHNTTLGAMEATDYKSIYGPNATFNGHPIDNTAVLIKYTYYGDTDFNGVVNFDDYSRTDAGFNGHKSGWLNGDFDGNGVVNFDDYSLIDLAFNTQGNARPRG